MKKLLLIPFIALFAIACSTDTEEITELANNNRSALKVIEIVRPPYIATLSQSCFDDLTAYPVLNTANGPGTGSLSFVSQPPSGITAGGYKVKVEIEELSDCEDISRGDGNVKIFTTDAIYTNVIQNPPVISGVKPSETYACYRWRMVFECVSKTGSTTCVSSTQWYDAPLF